MTRTALILGDQVSRENPALEGADRAVLITSRALLRRPGLHRQRAHLVLSGMRHLAADLREGGRIEVEERTEDGLLEGLDAIDGDVVCAYPSSAAMLEALHERGVELTPPTQFLTSPEAFARWAEGRKTLQMEPFYREQRRRLEVLVDDAGEPVGGTWNLDHDNRRPPPKGGLDAPDPWSPEEDDVDAGVRRDLDRSGIDFWGDDAPRAFAVTPDEASSALRSFVQGRLKEFGPWQDAMVDGERTLFHSLLSVPINLGVLPPLDAVRAAERAYLRDDAPLQSVEGFVRQIIGWREYVWGMYWLRAGQWPRRNALRAREPLPRAYREADSGWRCLDETVRSVRETGYAHHIERLMVLGTIGLTSGVRPWDLVRWFSRGFVDGAEWVMAPNAAGMALYADGGEMMSKPYAAGGNYVNKMSQHCPSCRFDPKRRTGEDACPLTALYWDFLDRHREDLAGNHRIAMPLRSLAKIPDDELEEIRVRARRARKELRGTAG
ncbi:cryptochrome/photolyase family protein [Patulibacter minatonensis]|uniref:cryptochrome/photolyase family protein n=1 Tax=Patulibacter minatonensis TaxID=298163 RepID=UPI00047A2598|nr:cryptochrome/photolyase family protein [Patulibacter minatonensis]